MLTQCSTLLQVRDDGDPGEAFGGDGDGQRRKSWQDLATAWMGALERHNMGLGKDGQLWVWQLFACHKSPFSRGTYSPPHTQSSQVQYRPNHGGG